METLSLTELERTVLESSYGDRYRRDFLLESVPADARLERLFAAETGLRLQELQQWSQGTAAVVVHCLAMWSDLNNGLTFLRNLQFRHTQRPVTACFGHLDDTFWNRLWAAYNDQEQIALLCEVGSDAETEALLLLKAVKIGLEGQRIDGEIFWADQLFQLTIDRLKSLLRGQEAFLVTKAVQQWADLWNFRVWQLRQRFSCDLPWLSTCGFLATERLAMSKTERKLFSETPWQKLHSPDEENTARALEEALLLLQSRMNRLDPLGPGVIVAYQARQLWELNRLNSILARIQLQQLDEKTSEGGVRP